MPATHFHRIAVFVGFLSLFHSAYSAAQHRSYLRLNDLEFTHLPLDITIQALISLFTIMYGVLHVTGDFKEIRAAAELDNRTWETFRNNPSFYTFNHRGKLLNSNYALFQREDEGNNYDDYDDED